MSDLAQFQTQFSLHFTNPQLLQSALTHSSYAKLSTVPVSSDNERLEFFGDAVLKLIVSEHIYHQFPGFDEGILTQMRSNIIADKTLAKMAKKINLGDYIRFSHGESNAGGQDRESNLANALEAVLGAIYLDMGYDKAKTFFLPLIHEHDPMLLSENVKKDYKSILQEWAQKQKSALPNYTVLSESGPDHDKVFEIQVSVEINSVCHSAIGKGQSKKLAQQDAAYHLVDHLKIT
jgi:ribonuclease-3